jgi:hypothetical protein
MKAASILKDAGANSFSQIFYIKFSPAFGRPTIWVLEAFGNFFVVALAIISKSSRNLNAFSQGC